MERFIHVTPSLRLRRTDDLGVDMGGGELGVQGALDNVCVR